MCSETTIPKVDFELMCNVNFCQHHESVVSGRVNRECSSPPFELSPGADVVPKNQDDFYVKVNFHLSTVLPSFSELNGSKSKHATFTI